MRLAIHWLGLLLVFAVSPVSAQLLVMPPPSSPPPRLSILPSGPNGWARVGGDFFDPSAPPRVCTLEVSSDLRRWQPAAVLVQTPFQYADPIRFSPRFYRMRLAKLTATNDWANQISLPYDPFLQRTDCEASDRLQWVKFAVVLTEPQRVFFQNSQKFLLHYDFAVNRLAAFRGMTPEQFNAVSLRRQNQQVILGAVVAPLSADEYGVQLVGLDPYPPAQVATLFEIVKSTISAGPNTRAFYLPTFEQAENALAHEEFFASRGIEISSVARWSQGQSVCYSPGWSLGRLTFVPAVQINAAYADGRLRPTDILLTDGVPSEVPYVAGMVALVPATPNSHVAILAQSYGIPFVYLADATEQQWVRALAGREVMLRTGAHLSDCQIQVLDVEGALDPLLKDAITALKEPEKINITPKEAYGAFSASTTNLVPADIRYFGGKASHFGLLRRTIPNYSPDAIAFSFDLWDAFLDQTLPGGQTLRTALQERLTNYAYPPDIASLRASLVAVRDLITKTARFSPAQQEAILTALMRFGTERPIRFRSSTNVEDSEHFTGAGLYDSFSGCLADDLDEDATGPSHCDPTEHDERGVFRAIQKVYASFYNENAFLERLRFRFNEGEVGMAVLVHHSTPDLSEQANGVATLITRRIGNSWQSSGKLVTQAGAVSVTNPDTSARPEVAEFLHFSAFTNVTLKESSSLVPLGTRVMAWPDDYRTLAGLLGVVAAAYAQFDTNRSAIQLDFEYKKVEPGRLSVKQVREIPLPDTTQQRPTFLLNDPLEFCVGAASQFVNTNGVSSDALAVHRLKSRWKLVTTNLALRQTNLAATLYPTAHVEFSEGPLGPTLDGSPALWPNAAHSVTSSLAANTWTLFDRWTLGTGPTRRDFTLATELKRAVTLTDSPLLTLADARLRCSVDYALGVPVAGPNDTTFLATHEVVDLFRCSWSTQTNPPVEQTLTTNRLTIWTSQKWVNVYGNAGPAFDPGCVWIAPKASYSYASLGGQTRLEGLLRQPLVLRGEFSQTFLKRGRQGHEDVTELIAEPGLEPGLSSEVQAELLAANIRLIYFRRYAFGASTEEIRILGVDGNFRTLSPR